MLWDINIYVKTLIKKGLTEYALHPPRMYIISCSRYAHIYAIKMTSCNILFLEVPKVVSGILIYMRRKCTWNISFLYICWWEFWFYNKQCVCWRHDRCAGWLQAQMIKPASNDSGCICEQIWKDQCSMGVYITINRTKWYCSKLLIHLVITTINFFCIRYAT